MEQETKQSNLANNTAKKQRGKGKPFVKNDPRINKEGRPEGSKNFTTLMDEAVREIAKVNNIKEGEVWQVLIKRGYSEAKDGNYPFYKDLLDRYYGKAKENVDITLGIKPTPILKDVFQHNRINKNSGTTE